MSGTCLAASGHSSQCDRPASSAPAPIANIVSVVVGLSETTRCGCAVNEIARPKSSRTTGDEMLREPLAGWRALSIALSIALSCVVPFVQDAAGIVSAANARVRRADL